MNKKLLSAFLVLIIIGQLAFPIGSVIYEKIAANKGETFKMRLSSVGMISYPDSDCGSLSLNYEINGDNILGNRYAIVAHDPDGFAKYELSSKRPQCENYIETDKRNYYFSMPITSTDIPVYERLSCVDFFIADTEQCKFSIERSGYITMSANEMYLEAKVYRGKVYPEAVYIDGQKAEDLLKELNDNFDLFYNFY